MKRDLHFVGDVHLERDDEHLEAFVAFLDSLVDRASCVVLLGDLFNLWIGRRDMERRHHRAVIERFRALRERGVRVRYVEGNRDYRIARAYAGWELDDAGGRGLVERIGGRSLFAIHGDLANPDDRQYRRWRALSRSAPFWLAFNALGRRLRLRMADSLEERFRATNLDYKGSFPEERVRRYADGFLRQGHDAVVLGHFHVERELAVEPPGPPGKIFVLPEWKSTRRHLRVAVDGTMAFEPSV